MSTPVPITQPIQKIVPIPKEIPLMILKSIPLPILIPTPALIQIPILIQTAEMLIQRTDARAGPLTSRRVFPKSSIHLPPSSSFKLSFEKPATFHPSIRYRVQASRPHRSDMEAYLELSTAPQNRPSPPLSPGEKHIVKFNSDGQRLQHSGRAHISWQSSCGFEYCRVLGFFLFSIPSVVYSWSSSSWVCNSSDFPIKICKYWAKVPVSETFTINILGKKGLP